MASPPPFSQVTLDGDASSDLSSRSSLAINTSAPNGRYLLQRLSPPMWGKLAARGDVPVRLPPPLHAHHWVDECFEDSPDAASEWHMKTDWKALLAGSRGAGMYNHSDSLQVGSWHAHVAGRKWWHLCRRGECYEGIVEAGQILTYGAGWYHETQCVDTPTITLTGSIVQAAHFTAFSKQIANGCTFDGEGQELSSTLCAAWKRCLPKLRRQLTGRKKERRSQIQPK